MFDHLALVLIIEQYSNGIFVYLSCTVVLLRLLVLIDFTFPFLSAMYFSCGAISMCCYCYYFFF